MRFVALSELPQGVRYYKYGKNQKLLAEFLESGEKFAEVSDWTNGTAANCATSLSGTAKKFNFGVTIISRGGKVYLIRNDEIKE